MLATVRVSAKMSLAVVILVRLLSAQRAVGPAETQDQPATYDPAIVEVVDDAGAAVPSATVSLSGPLKDRNSETNSWATDTEGKCSFPVQQGERYGVRVTAQGFYSGWQDPNIRGGSADAVFVKVVLRKREPALVCLDDCGDPLVLPLTAHHSAWVIDGIITTRPIPALKLPALPPPRRSGLAPFLSRIARSFR